MHLSHELPTSNLNSFSTPYNLGRKEGSSSLKCSPNNTWIKLESFFKLKWIHFNHSNHSTSSKINRKVTKRSQPKENLERIAEERSTLLDVQLSDELHLSILKPTQDLLDENQEVINPINNPLHAFNHFSSKNEELSHSNTPIAYSKKNLLEALHKRFDFYPNFTTQKDVETFLNGLQKHNQHQLKIMGFRLSYLLYQLKNDLNHLYLSVIYPFSTDHFHTIEISEHIKNHYLNHPDLTLNHLIENLIHKDTRGFIRGEIFLATIGKITKQVDAHVFLRSYRNSPNLPDLSEWIPSDSRSCIKPASPIDLKNFGYLGWLSQEDKNLNLSVINRKTQKIHDISLRLDLDLKFEEEYEKKIKSEIILFILSHYRDELTERQPIPERLARNQNEALDKKILATNQITKEEMLTLLMLPDFYVTIRTLEQIKKLFEGTGLDDFLAYENIKALANDTLTINQLKEEEILNLLAIPNFYHMLITSKHIIPFLKGERANELLLRKHFQSLIKKFNMDPQTKEDLQELLKSYEFDELLKTRRASDLLFKNIGIPIYYFRQKDFVKYILHLSDEKLGHLFLSTYNTQTKEHTTEVLFNIRTYSTHLFSHLKEVLAEKADALAK
jgi:hypothetical protein